VVNRRADGFYLAAANTEEAISAGAGDLFDFTGAGDTAVAAIAASLAAGEDLTMAVHIAALAMAVTATQPGMAVAPAADLLAVLTPQGRARRKVVLADAAVDQIAHWRRSGFKTGLITAPQGRIPVGSLEQLRRQCDRLVLGYEGEVQDAIGLSGTESLAAADLICVAAAGTLQEMISQLRPDLVVDGAAGLEPTA
jgi:D-beta-D-heptose 7-phosphate kinase/D-beta-D-heptose 1-phosphate adenosyltransferase